MANNYTNINLIGETKKKKKELRYWVMKTVVEWTG
jgi:hypothetical protein